MVDRFTCGSVWKGTCWDHSYSPFSGAVVFSSKEDFDKRVFLPLKKYEIATLSHFYASNGASQDFGSFDINILRSPYRSRMVRWGDDTNKINRKSGVTSANELEYKLPFTGTPFMIIGTKTYSCYYRPKSYPPSRKKKRKRINKKCPVEEEEKPKTDHSYTNLAEGEKAKSCCMAKCHLVHVVYFPGFKVHNNINDRNKYTRRLASALLKDTLESSNPFVSHQVIYFFADPRDHKCREHEQPLVPLDYRLVEKISQLNEEGMSKTIDYHKRLKVFVKKVVLAGTLLSERPSESDRRYFPNFEDVRVQIYHAKIRKRLAKLGVEITKEEIEDDQTSYLSLPVRSDHSSYSQCTLTQHVDNNEDTSQEATIEPYIANTSTEQVPNTSELDLSIHQVPYKVSIVPEPETKEVNLKSEPVPSSQNFESSAHPDPVLFANQNNSLNDKQNTSNEIISPTSEICENNKLDEGEQPVSKNPKLVSAVRSLLQASKHGSSVHPVVRRHQSRPPIPSSKSGVVTNGNGQTEESNSQIHLVLKNFKPGSSLHLVPDILKNGQVSVSTKTFSENTPVIDSLLQMPPSSVCETVPTSHSSSCVTNLNLPAVNSAVKSSSSSTNPMTSQLKHILNKFLAISNELRTEDVRTTLDELLPLYERAKEKAIRGRGIRLVYEDTGTVDLKRKRKLIPKNRVIKRRKLSPKTKNAVS